MIQKHRRGARRRSRAAATSRRPRSTRPRRRSTTATRTSPSARGARRAAPAHRRARQDRIRTGRRRRPRSTRRRRSPTNADEKAALAEKRPRQPRASPTRTIRSFIYLWNRRSTAQARTRAAVSCASSTARSPGSSAIRGRAPTMPCCRKFRCGCVSTPRSKLADVDAAKGKLAEIERRGLVADGVEAAEARVEQADAAMKKAEEAVAKTTAELQQVEAERQREVGAGENAAYSGAIDLLAEGLARDDLNASSIRRPCGRRPRKTSRRSRRFRSRAKHCEKLMRRWHRSAPRSASWRSAATSSKARATAHAGSATTIRWETSAATPMSSRARSVASWPEFLRGNDLDRVLRDNYHRPRPRVDPDFGGGHAGTWTGPWVGPGESPWGGDAPSSGGGGSDDDGGWRTEGKF